MKRKRKDYRPVTLLLTQEQYQALNDASHAEGTPLTVKARQIISDALKVPRSTLLETI